jgi:hypothetical protein
MQQVTIPGLYCPFPSKINPLVEEADQHTAYWVKQFDLVASDDVLHAYRREKFAWMVSRMFPHANADALFAFCDLNTFLFFLDDLFDHQGMEAGFKNETKFKQFVHKLTGILRYNQKTTLSKDGPIFAAFGELWQRLKEIGSSSWQKQFISSIDAIFDAAIWQFENECRNILPSLSDYMLKRQYLGAANVATDTIPIAGNINLPDHVYNNKVVHRLTELCRNTVCWSNDLFSFSKEMSHQDQYNLVAILKRERDLSLEEAITATIHIHDEQVREFLVLANVATMFSDSENEQLLQYIDALATLMRGNIDWSFQETSRYQFIYKNELSQGLKYHVTMEFH